MCIDLGLASNEILVHEKGLIYFMERNKLKNSILITQYSPTKANKMQDNESVRSGRSLQILKPLNAMEIVQAARAQTSEVPLPIKTVTIATQTVKPKLVDLETLSTQLTQTPKQHRYPEPLSDRSKSVSIRHPYLHATLSPQHITQPINSKFSFQTLQKVMPEID